MSSSRGEDGVRTWLLDVHVYGGVVLAAIGAGLFHVGAGFLVAGVGLFIIARWG